VRAVVNGGQSYAAAARKFNTTPKTVAKWVKRFRAEGVDGLCDRSSRPHSSDSQASHMAMVHLRDSWRSYLNASFDPGNPNRVNYPESVLHASSRVSPQ
jgi:transposase-like protein